MQAPRFTLRPTRNSSFSEKSAFQVTTTGTTADGSVTLTDKPHMKQHLPVSCLPLLSKTCCLGTAKADIDPANIVQARAATNITLCLFVFENAFMSLLLSSVNSSCCRNC